MGNSIQLQWTDFDSISRTVTINVSNIKYSLSGQNIKVPANNIKPYVIPMGYTNPTIELKFKCNNTTYDILNTLISDALITATVVVADFPEFQDVTTSWYSDNLSLNRNQSYGTTQFDGSITLTKYYG